MLWNIGVKNDVMETQLECADFLLVSCKFLNGVVIPKDAQGTIARNTSQPLVTLRNRP